MVHSFFDDWILMKNQMSRYNILSQSDTSPRFRSYLLAHVQNKGQLHAIVQTTCGHIFRHQQLLQSKSSYYVACDVSTRTRYICYKDIVMLDFDVGKADFASKEDILSYLTTEVKAKYPCIIHETCHGYHCFLVDKRRQHNSFDTFMFLRSFRQDPNYSLYCYIRGFSVRLTRKRDDDHTQPLYKVIHSTKPTSQSSVFMREMRQEIGVMFHYMDGGNETCLMK